MLKDIRMYGANTHPIVGQECACPDGVGRVHSFGESVAGARWIRVDTYIANRGCQWDARNVRLYPMPSNVQVWS